MLPAYNLSNSFTHEPTRPLSAPEAHEKQDFFQRISLGSPSSCSAHLPPAEAAIDKAAVREDENFAPGPVPDEAPCFSSERRAPRGLGTSEAAPQTFVRLSRELRAVHYRLQVKASIAEHLGQGGAVLGLTNGVGIVMRTALNQYELLRLARSVEQAAAKLRLNEPIFGPMNH